MDTSFRRRIYRNLGELVADFRSVMAQRKAIRPLMRGEVIDSAFRERLMLAVTAVNECRYCSYAHAREALAKGISPEELEALQNGMFEGSPPDEVPALLYAQHWAESEGHPEAALHAQMVARYGEQTMAAIDLALQMIRAGNLSGNTFDYLLYRLSFGRLGGG
ncbi:MAG: carboxymuconolactone decarboxylase family protein [Anaerolineae bacterium]|nr:carboxymuconolactone decarboxylase family protein [Anaerolineae bacterium]